MYKPLLQYLLFPSHTYSTNLNLKNKETNKNMYFINKYGKASSWELKTYKEVMIEILRFHYVVLIKEKIPIF